jgi:signal transduction histidine kinase
MSLFSNRRKWKLTLASIASLGIAVVFLYAYISFRGYTHLAGHEALELQDSWTACVPVGAERPCKEVDVGFPDIALRGLRVGDWKEISYVRKFVTPEFCSSSPGHGCVFAIGGVYREAEAFVNGQSLGIHYTKSDLYPAFFKIPPLLLNSSSTPNLINLKIRSTGTSFYPAILQGPVGVYSAHEADRIGESIIGERVVLPLMSAAACFTAAIFTLFWLLSRNSSARGIGSFFLYCAVTGVYMLNATRLPREVLDEPIASSLNFVLRLLMDFCLVILVSTYFGIGPRWDRRLRIVFVLPITVMAVFLIGSTFSPLFNAWASRDSVFSGLPGLRAGTPVYLTFAVFSPLAFIPSLIGLYKAVRGFSVEPASFVLLVLFVFLSPMQIADVATIMGLIQVDHEIYFMRMYTPLIAIAFGFAIWIRWIRHELLNETVMRVGAVASGVAHDLRSPIASLRFVLANSNRIDPDEKVLITSAVDRLDGVASQLLHAYTTSKVDDETLEQELPAEASLDAIVLSLLNLRNPALAALSRAPIEFDATQEARNSAICKIQCVQVTRAIDNIIGNSVDATTVSDCPKVRVILGVSKKWAILSVEDNGPGFDPRILAGLQRGEFGATTKPKGHGIGLNAVSRVVSRQGGKLEFENRKGARGARVSLNFPLAKRELKGSG